MRKVMWTAQDESARSRVLQDITKLFIRKPSVMITMDFGISPGCYQVEGVKTLNYSGNSVVK